MGERQSAVEGVGLSKTSLPNPAFWAGKRVLLTGHTGLKGGWAALWLAAMGAKVTGFALAPDTEPSLFELAGIGGDVRSVIGDLRDEQAVRAAVGTADPEIVLHLAAQPLVRRSIAQPIETFATNVQGTAHLLTARRERKTLTAVLVVTSDKVYLNDQQGRPFVEGDELGGKDPYAASKAAAEIVVCSFAASYFDKASVPVATAAARARLSPTRRSLRNQTMTGGCDIRAFCSPRIARWRDRVRWPATRAAASSDPSERAWRAATGAHRRDRLSRYR